MIIVVTLITLVILLTYWGFVGSILWNWFLPPLGVPEITWLHAVGLMCVTGCFWYRYIPRTENDSIKGITESLILPSWFLLIGLVAKELMKI